MTENRPETEQERFKRVQTTILEAYREHERLMKEDPEYRAKSEEIGRRLDDYYSFGTKPKE